MTDEVYERNYIAIERTEINNGVYSVTGYFANHEFAWRDDNMNATRAIAQNHAEFLIKEFSMGGENNPIAIVHLNDQREVLVKKDGQWLNTFKKVKSRI